MLHTTKTETETETETDPTAQDKDLRETTTPQELVQQRLRQTLLERLQANASWTVVDCYTPEHARLDSRITVLEGGGLCLTAQETILSESDCSHLLFYVEAASAPHPMSSVQALAADPAPQRVQARIGHMRREIDLHPSISDTPWDYLSAEQLIAIFQRSFGPEQVLARHRAIATLVTEICYTFPTTAAQWSLEAHTSRPLVGVRADMGDMGEVQVLRSTVEGQKALRELYALARATVVSIGLNSGILRGGAGPNMLDALVCYPLPVPSSAHGKAAYIRTRHRP